MSKQPANLTTVHCVMFPLFVYSASDGDMSDDELKDIVMTSNTLTEVFNNVSKEDALRMTQESLEWLGGMKMKEALNVACWCCGQIHDGLKENSRELVIKFYEDQIKADGKVTEIEQSLHKVFSMIIREGLPKS